MIIKQKLPGYCGALQPHGLWRKHLFFGLP